MRKMKIVWLCHFANDEINDYNKTSVNEIAPWISQFIELVRGSEELEVHIVAPNYFNNADETFYLNNIYYHFFKYHSGVFSIEGLRRLEIAFTNGRRIENRVSTIVRLINPDIVHLFGSENITYSQGLIPIIGEYPIIVSLQGFIGDVVCKGGFLREIIINRQIDIEKTINNNCINFTSSTINKVWNINFEKKYPNKNILYLKFPTRIPHMDNDSIYNKKYDLVFWGRVCENKGIEDFIKVVAILSNRKNNIKALIIGACSARYFRKLSKIIKVKKVQENISFAGFQKDPNDLFRLAMGGKAYLFPTYFDGLPGSIRESMHMGIPIVSYAVGRIPLFNKNRKCVVLANVRDIQDLAEKTWMLLTNEDYYNEMKTNILLEAKECYSNNGIYQQLMSCYNSLL